MGILPRKRRTLTVSVQCLDANLAVEFFEGTLPAKRAADIEGHIARCSDCRTLVAELARSPSFASQSPTIPRMEEPHAALESGDVVGRFAVISRVGRGGMGVVFLAYDPRLDRNVALKLLRGSDGGHGSADEAKTRLLREAQAIAQLSHPNVISVYDVGTYKGQVYIAMEFVRGMTLTDWLRKSKRSWREVHSKFREAGLALAAAHARGLVHRDFKPDNVLVGEDERVRVMDFGLARSVYETTAYATGLAPAFRHTRAQSALNRTLTRTGAMLGTPRYMAPEQFAGRETDARSDQFSYCVAFHEALYGEHPFVANTAEPAYDSSSEQQERNLSGIRRARPTRADVPNWLRRALNRGLHTNPARRYPSMDVLLRDTKAPVPTRSPGWRAGLLTGAVAAVVLVGFVLQSRAQTQSLRKQLIAAEQATHAHLEHLHTARTKNNELLDAIDREKLRNKQLEERNRELAEKLVAANVYVASLERIMSSPRKRKRKAAVGSGRREKAAIRSHLPDIRMCANEWRRRETTAAQLRGVPLGALTTKVNVDLIVEPSGKLRTWTYQVSPAEQQILGKCVSPNVVEATFPANRKARRIRASFEFRIDSARVNWSVSVDYVPH